MRLIVRLDNMEILLMLVIKGLLIVGDCDGEIKVCVLYVECREEFFEIIFLGLSEEVKVEGFELEVWRRCLVIKGIFLLFLFCLRVGFKNDEVNGGVKVMVFFDCDWNFLNGEVSDVEDIFNKVG